MKAAAPRRGGGMGTSCPFRRAETDAPNPDYEAEDAVLNARL
jgi:hypothetical protein